MFIAYSMSVDNQKHVLIIIHISNFNEIVPGMSE